MNAQMPRITTFPICDFGRELTEQRILLIGTYRPHEVEPHSSLMQVRAKLGR
ncbi:hypothetical protein U27_00953 [Candidatus Vecturithrix granuli]|uniref:Uncharacterized protein n=1 Tax=Vecturithrix granuli TaxID=1499967 RepID=A0A081C900_VECG1|nr:hypothetical protein U27_00953 [Candidatus Vecturithrix granuli]